MFVFLLKKAIQHLFFKKACNNRSCSCLVFWTYVYFVMYKGELQPMLPVINRRQLKLSIAYKNNCKYKKKFQMSPQTALENTASAWLANCGN